MTTLITAAKETNGLAEDSLNIEGLPLFSF